MVERYLVDDALFALADPTRRAIVARLAKGDARVTDVAAPFPLSLNAVSKHIRVLERGGLVRREKQGREHVLSLEPRALDRAADAIEKLRALWAWRLEKLDRILKETSR
jgi:DNA-binding transcriptional ArsR family regulator